MPQITVTCKTMDGTSVEISCSDTDTVAHLKKRITERADLDTKICLMQLFSNNASESDDQGHDNDHHKSYNTLVECGIKDGSNVFFLIKVESEEEEQEREGRQAKARRQQDAITFINQTEGTYEYKFELYIDTFIDDAELSDQDTGKKFQALMNEAISSRHWDVVNGLIKVGAYVNAHDHDGKTALIYAVQAVEVQVVKLLLEKGANVNAHDHDGKTALMLVDDLGLDASGKQSIKAELHKKTRSDNLYIMWQLLKCASLLVFTPLTVVLCRISPLLEFAADYICFVPPYKLRECADNFSYTGLSIQWNIYRELLRLNQDVADGNYSIWKKIAVSSMTFLIMAPIQLINLFAGFLWFNKVIPSSYSENNYHVSSVIYENYYKNAQEVLWDNYIELAKEIIDQARTYIVSNKGKCFASAVGLGLIALGIVIATAGAAAPILAAIIKVGASIGLGSAVSTGVAASTAGVAVTALFSCLVKDAKPEDDHGDHGDYQGI